jgi:two-component system sensor histidine kinase HydH
MPIEVPPPPGSEEIESEELARLFGKVVGVRMLIAPVLGMLAAAWAFFETAPWRRAVLFFVPVCVISISLFELWRYRRRGYAPSSLYFNVGLGVVGQLVLTAATGGLESPLAPVLILLALITGLLCEPFAVRAGFLAVQGLGIWGLFAASVVLRPTPSWIPNAFGGGSRAGHGDFLLFTQAAVLTMAALAATTVGKNMRSVFRAIVRRALAAQEESLQVHADRSRELMALSGEIAHELKNPMASVKGLAALLEKGAADAKTAERLQILRREADRMQGILDEFLNFSRPLVPLSVQPVDLAALCREVASLYEGLAREKGVPLSVGGAAAPVRGDARKLKQVVINLVQNALDASPAGCPVELAVSDEDGAACVRVLDRGPGLDPSVDGRAFEPGVTTKARGSGLGLTIARALARQHSGELVLEARDGGGCQAHLTVPRAESQASPAGGAA